MRNKYGIVPYTLDVSDMVVDGSTANDLPSDLLDVVLDCFHKNKLLYLTIIYNTFKYVGLVHIGNNGNSYFIKIDCYGGTQFGTDIALNIFLPEKKLYVWWSEV